MQLRTINFLPALSEWTSIFCGAVLVSSIALSVQAEGLGWRLPALATNADATPPEALTGWALPAGSKVTRDAAGRGAVRPADRPVAPLFRGAALVSTGFAGHVYGRPVLPEDQRAAARANPDYQVIDLDGAVVTLTDIEGYGHAMNGDEVTRPADDRLYARQIGQVFGAVLDDDLHPNLYLAATSVFGLQITGPDTNADTLRDRLTLGAADAEWMAGQWGFDPLSGPGTIWRVDGLTGQVAIFANLTQDSNPNPGASLGNLAIDTGHNQLFASDLSNGLISRIDMRGTVVETFDHGLTARVAEGLPAIADDPTLRLSITDPGFDSLDPSTWGFAPVERRVWGLTVAEGRLFYAVAQGMAAMPEVWSVGLDRKTGAFRDDPRWELTLSDSLPGFEISDMGFSPDGALVLAQHGPRMPAYDFSTFADVGTAEVVRYTREAPVDDPSTPSVWVPESARYAVGFAGSEANTTGGLAFGPGYDAEGFLDFSQCLGTLWITGEGLRNNPALQADLSPGGQLSVDGAQAQPVGLLRAENSPPWVSYGHDFDASYPKTPQIGYVGDVAVLGCNGAQLAVSGGGSGGGSDGNGGKGQCKGKSCDWLACAKDPKACKPKENACVRNEVTLRCDGKTGTYVAEVAQVPLHIASLNTVKLTDPSGKITSLPATQTLPSALSVPLTGLAPGQIGQIKLCSYDAAAAADGLPHDCCNSTVEFKVPAKACVKEIQ